MFRKKKEKKPRKTFVEMIDNMNVMDYLVFICITSINVFVVVSLYYYYRYGIPVSDIKEVFFAFFGTELLAMAGISISSNIAKAQQNRRERKEEERYDEL